MLHKFCKNNAFVQFLIFVLVSFLISITSLLNLNERVEVCQHSV